MNLELRSSHVIDCGRMDSWYNYFANVKASRGYTFGGSADCTLPVYGTEWGTLDFIGAGTLFLLAFAFLFLIVYSAAQLRKRSVEPRGPGILHEDLLDDRA